MPRQKKDMIPVTRQQLEDWHYVNSVFGINPGGMGIGLGMPIPIAEASGGSSKSTKKKPLGRISFFVAPVATDDATRELITNCGVRQFNHTTFENGEPIITCYTDLRIVLSNYITNNHLGHDDVILIDGYIWRSLGRGFFEMISEKSGLINVGDDIYIRKSRGIVNIMAAAIVDRLKRQASEERNEL